MGLFSRHLWRLTCYLGALGSCLGFMSASQPHKLELGPPGSYADSLGVESPNGPLDLAAESSVICSTKWRCDPREKDNPDDLIQLAGSNESFPLVYVMKKCCLDFFSHDETRSKTLHRVQRFKMCFTLFCIETCLLHSVNNRSLVSRVVDSNENLSSVSKSTLVTPNLTALQVIRKDVKKMIERLIDKYIFDDISSSIVRGIEHPRDANNHGSTAGFKSDNLHSKFSANSMLKNFTGFQRHEPASRSSRRIRRNVHVSSTSAIIKEIFNWFAPSDPGPPPLRVESRMMDLSPGEQLGDVYEECRSVHKATGCGLAPIKRSQRVKRIINGYRSRDHEWPWVVSIYTIPDPTYWFVFSNGLSCGGVLLTQQVVLSCAHCFHSIRYTMSAKKIKVAAGTNSNYDDPSAVNVQRFLLHPEYDAASFGHDLSLLLLDRPLEYQVKIQPVCLPPPRVTDLVGEMGTVLGWGYTSIKGPTSHWLHETDVRILSGEECRSFYAKTPFSFELPEGSFCAGFEDGRTDACAGDSGGPLLIEDPCGVWQVVGIVSNGYSCAQPNQPGIYTDVIFHRYWITNNTASWEREAGGENMIRLEDEQKSSAKVPMVDEDSPNSMSNAM